MERMSISTINSNMSKITKLSVIPSTLHYTDDELIKLVEGNLILNIDKLLLTVYIGIPNHLRGKFWIFICDKSNMSLEHSKLIYDKLVMLQDNKITKCIEKDLLRTKLFSLNLVDFKLSHMKALNNSVKTAQELIKKGENDFRKRSFSISYKKLGINESLLKIDANFLRKDLISDRIRNSLKNILRAYAAFDCSVGYPQGLNYITAMLLVYIEKESDCFWFLMQLMQKYNLREFFIEGTPKINNLMKRFKRVLVEKLPDLYLHYKNIDFMKYMIGVISHYFITLFTYNVYVEYSKVIIDYFLIKGDEVLIDTLIHLLVLKEDELLCLNFDESAIAIKKDFVNVCIEEFGVEGCLPYDRNQVKV